MADSLHCAVETNNIVRQLYTNKIDLKTKIGGFSFVKFAGIALNL